jgi:hypothetical protein
MPSTSMAKRIFGAKKTIKQPKGEEEIMRVAFRIYGGGGNRTRKKVLEVGENLSIIDYVHQNDNLFIREEDFFIESESEKTLEDFCGVFDCSGNRIWSLSELENAKKTGLGYLDIDGDYNTIYVCDCSDLEEDEIFTIVEAGYGWALEEEE